MSSKFTTALREAAEASVQHHSSSTASLIRQAFYDGVEFGMKHARADLDDFRECGQCHALPGEQHTPSVG